MTGWLAIAGLGPGNAALVTPEVSAALAEATDVIGYIPYVARVAARDGLTLHASDNRVEIDRARHALDLASQGRRVVVVSSGDPGVFAMAAAVFEALEAGPQDWCAIDIRVLPGITAMLAASARAGAPLGHDFCAINLSDNLKPWALIERRVALAAEADFAIAFYNPRSKARPDGLVRAFEILRETGGDSVRLHQSLVARRVERAALDDQVVVGQARRMVGRIDEPEQIVVLRLGGKGIDVHSPERQQDAARAPGERGDRGVDVGDVRPVIARDWRPGGAGQRDMRYADAGCCGDRVRVHLRGEGMRGIDQMRDVAIGQIVGEAVDPAKSTDAHRNGLGARLGDAAGIAERGRVAAEGQLRRERAGLRRAAEDQDVRHG